MVFAEKIIEKRSFWPAYLFVISLLCLSCCLSFDLLAEKPLLAIDSSIYYMAGERWLRGEIPYRDVFDHKGPLLYLINLLAAFCGGERIFFVFEFAVFAVTAFIIKKTLSYFVDEKQTALLLLLLPLAISFCTTPTKLFGGNLPDEYAMPFIAYCLLYMVQHIKIAEKSVISGFLLGFSFGALLLLKINLIFPGLPIGVVLLYDSVRKKDAKRLIIHFFTISAGLLVILLPFAVYFYLKHAFSAYWLDNFIYNFQYNSISPSIKSNNIRHILLPVRILNCFLSTFSVMSIPFCLTAGMFIFQFFSKKNVYLSGIFLLFMGCFYLAEFSGRYVMNYYYFAAVPVLLCTMGMILQYYPQKTDMLSLIMFVLLISNGSLFYKNCKQIPSLRAEASQVYCIPSEMRDIVTEIKTGSVMILDKHSYSYHALKHLPVSFSKYMYLPLNYSDTLRKDLEEILKSGRVHIVYYPEQCRFPQLLPTIQQHFNLCKEGKGYLLFYKKR